MPISKEKKTPQSLGRFFKFPNAATVVSQQKHKQNAVRHSEGLVEEIYIRVGHGKKNLTDGQELVDSSSDSYLKMIGGGSTLILF